MKAIMFIMLSLAAAGGVAALIMMRNQRRATPSMQEMQERAEETMSQVA